MNFRIDARRFLHRILDALDVGELRTNVKVKQSQHVDAAGVFKAIDDFQQFRGSQSELGGFTS